MLIKSIELLNVVLVISILTLSRSKKTGWLLAALFSYGSLYFLYSAIPLVTGAPLFEITAMHAAGVGSGMLVKASTALFLFTIFIALGMRAKRLIAVNFEIYLYFSAIMAMILIGYIINFRTGDWLQLQNVISIEGMLALILIGYMGCRSDATALNITRKHLFIINSVLFFAAIVAVYEVFSQRAWAGTVTQTDLLISRVNRASSIFFNPNLYAYWSSLVIMGFSWGLYKHNKYRNILLTGISIASVGLYFSGGRSAVILLLFILFLTALFSKRESLALRWLPFTTPLIVFLFIYLVSRFAFIFSFEDRQGWESVLLLGERFAATPVNLLQYLLSKTSLANSFPLLSSMSSTTPQIIESIEGRFMVARTDSGFLTLFMDTGLLGLAAFIFSWGFLFFWGIRRYIKVPDANSVYSLAFLLHCFLVGFSMRFQVFPIWLFIGVSLVFCIHFWRANE